MLFQQINFFVSGQNKIFKVRVTIILLFLIRGQDGNRIIITTELRAELLNIAFWGFYLLISEALGKTDNCTRGLRFGWNARKRDIRKYFASSSLYTSVFNLYFSRVQILKWIESSKYSHISWYYKFYNEHKSI